MFLIKQNYSKNNIFTVIVSILFGISLLIIPMNPGYSQESDESSKTKFEDLEFNGFTHTYNFSRPEILSEKGYSSISLAGLDNFGGPGEPILPFKTCKILIPQNKVVANITIDRLGLTELNGSYLLEPGAECVPITNVQSNKNDQYDSQKNITFNKKIYQAQIPFPAELFTEIGTQTYRGYNILILNIFPVRYIPNPGLLSYYQSMKVIIKFEDNTQPNYISQTAKYNSYRGLAKDDLEIQTLVDNPEIISTYNEHVQNNLNTFNTIQYKPSSLVNPAKSYDYVIITNNDLNSSSGEFTFQDLINSKIKKGLNATIVTVENITADPAYWNTTSSLFNDTQAQIRNFILDAYLNWGIDYVLLGGDGDGKIQGGETVDPIIPARGLSISSSTSDNNIPADLYYAALDGNWNNDEDSSWGEYPSEVDLYGEVFIGRAPVDNDTELSNFVRKILAYDNTSTSDPYLKDIWMVGEHLGFGGVSEYAAASKDEVRFGSSANGYTTVGIPLHNNIDTLYDRDHVNHNWPKSDIIKIINNNTHVINHLGHSSVGYTMKMYNSDVDTQLSNNKYFFGYSQGCYGGAFDNRGSSGSYMTYDCILEHLVASPYGAFAFIGNSRYGWGSSYSTNGPSQHFDREFFDAIYGENIKNLGKANQDSKHDSIGFVSSDMVRWCYYEVNLFGDPEIELKEYPKPEHDITVEKLEVKDWVELNQTIFINGTIRNIGKNNESNIKVNLTINGSKINSTTISLLKVDSFKEISFNWTPNRTGSYNIFLEASFVKNENITTNNNKSKIIWVPKDVIFVAILDSWGADNYFYSIWDDLSSQWYKYGEYALRIDYTSLNKENIDYSDLKNSSADVLVISDACRSSDHWEFSNDEILAIKQYTQDGHGLVGTSGTLSTNASNNMKLAPLFGLDSSPVGTWYRKFNKVFNLTEPNNLLFKNIPNPYTVGKDYTVKGLKLNSSDPGKIVANSTDNLAMIVEYKGNQTQNGSAIYLTHIPEYAPETNSNDKQLMYNSFIWAKINSMFEHDIAMIDLHAPAWVEVNHTTWINGTIKNLGLNDENNIQVNLTVNGIINATKIITKLKTGESQQISFSWTPTKNGKIQVSINASIVPGEIKITNNIISTYVDVKYLPSIWVNNKSFNVKLQVNSTSKEKLVIGNNGKDVLNFSLSYINVAIEYGGKMDPPLKMMKALIESYGYNANIVRGRDIDTIQELNRYNVVILGSSGYDYDDDFSYFESNLINWVENYSGAVIGTSAIEWVVDEKSELGQLLPVDTGPAYGVSGQDYDYHLGGELTINDSHRITKNVSNIQVPSATSWSTTRHGLNTGAIQLGQSPTSNPAVACWVYGTGRVAYLAAGYFLGEVDYNSDWWYADENSSRLLMNAIAWASQLDEHDWFKLNRTNGTVKVNGQTSIDININATNLEFKEYFGYIFIAHNDLNTPIIKIQITLIVTDILIDIKLSPTNWYGTIGNSCSFTSLGYDRFGNQVEFEEKWSTTDPDGNVVGGLYTPGKVGNWKVYCSNSNNSVSGYANVIIDPGCLHHIEMSELSWEGSINDIAFFDAVGYDIKNNVINFTKFWSCTDPNGVVYNGVYFPGTLGNWRVYCNNSDNTISNFTTVHITTDNLAHIEISTDLWLGTADDQVTFEAVGYDKNYNIFVFDEYWSTTDPWGTVTNDGLYSAGKEGIWKVYCNNSDNTISDYVTVLVDHGKLKNIQIKPDHPTVNADETIQFTALGCDSDGNIFSITPTWGVSGGGKIWNNGLYDPIKVGDWEVYAEVNSISNKTTIKVIPGTPAQIFISPNESYITADDFLEFVGLMTDSEGNHIDQEQVLGLEITWECTNGEISPSGNFIPEKTGDITIEAKNSKYKIKATAVVHVSPGELHSLSITPTSAAISTDEVLQFHAAGSDKKSNSIELSKSSYILNWSAEDGNIDSNGLYYPKNVGVWDIIVEAKKIVAWTIVEVVAGKLKNIRISPESATITIGEQINFTVEGIDFNDNEMELFNNDIQWSTSDNEIGKIDETGLFTAYDHGIVIVKCVYQELMASAIIIINPEDFDSDNIPDYLDEDDDNDGMTDAWEEKYGLDPNDPGDGELDADNDGYSNFEEYENNTDPNDSTKSPFNKSEQSDDEPIMDLGIIFILIIIIIILLGLIAILLHRIKKKKYMKETANSFDQKNPGVKNNDNDISDEVSDNRTEYVDESDDEFEDDESEIDWE